jgi:hypothetical protein
MVVTIPAILATAGDALRLVVTPAYNMNYASSLWLEWFQL